MAPVRTIFFGSGSFALPVLEVLRSSPASDLVAVVTAPPRPAGRKGRSQATPVGEAAAELALPIQTPTRLRDETAIAELAALDAPLVVLADYGRLVPQSVLDMPALGALNLHPSLLPRHRGAVPVPAAILAGDDQTGVTLMRMDAGPDSGPIVAQVSYPLDGTETSPELEAALAAEGAALLARSLDRWIAGDIEAVPQADDGATLTRPLRRPDGLLDPSAGAAALERQVRAYQPWPGSFLETADGRLVVWRAEVGPSEGDAMAGDIVDDADGVALVTTEGHLRLLEVQPAGGKRMPGPDYRRGRKR